jgi:hypothetical protein
MVLAAGILTLPFGLAASLGPKLSVKAFSTAFFTSSGFAHRSSGVLFTALIAGPKLAHPGTVFVVMYLLI